MGYVQVGIIIIMALLISITFTALAIPILQRLHTGQNIREDGPESHMTKGGTPTMGGVAVILATMFTCMTTREFSIQIGVISAPGVFFGALAGACLGFLVFNRNPARIFMGDTGSLALGGGVAVAAVMMEMELFLPIVGFVYVAESLSVIIQVVSFKTRKKRVFKMAPLHHHFELSGFKETHVVGMFWFVTLVFCIIGFAIL